MEYDEAREWIRFVWGHYRHLTTAFERRVGWAIIGRQTDDSAFTDDPEAYLLFSPFLGQRLPTVALVNPRKRYSFIENITFIISTKSVV